MALGSLTVPLSGCSQWRDFYLHLFKERTRHKKRLTCKRSSISLSHYKGTTFFVHPQIFQPFYFKKWSSFRQTLQIHKNKDTKSLHAPIFVQKRQNVQFRIV